MAHRRPAPGAAAPPAAALTMSDDPYRIRFSIRNWTAVAEYDDEWLIRI